MHGSQHLVEGRLVNELVRHHELDRVKVRNRIKQGQKIVYVVPSDVHLSYDGKDLYGHYPRHNHSSVKWRHKMPILLDELFPLIFRGVSVVKAKYLVHDREEGVSNCKEDEWIESFSQQGQKSHEGHHVVRT